MKSASPSARGKYWEEIAARHLRRKGLAIIARGYRCRLGELDIVCRDGAELVVVEVRARSVTRHADALGSIGHAKRRRIVQATRHYLMCHPCYGSTPLRFDVIAIDAIDSPHPTIEWIKDAFAGT